MLHIICTLISTLPALDFPDKIKTASRKLFNIKMNLIFIKTSIYDN